MANPIEIQRLIAAQRKRGFKGGDQRVYIRISDARQRLMEAMVDYLGERTQWTQEYDEVAQWLTDNEGRGLMLIGNPGRGKTVLIHHVLPRLLNEQLHLYVNCYTALELNDYEIDPRGKVRTQYQRIVKENKIIAVDDIGTEPDAQVFKEQHCYFSELVDECERKQKLLLCSTNLDRDELVQRYRLRTMDRLTAITRRVWFEGESFRR